MKKLMSKKLMGYIALALVCVLAGTAIGTLQPAASAETQTVVLTSPFTEAISKVRNSVVGVNNYQIVSNYGNSYGYGYGQRRSVPLGYFFGYGNGGGYGNGTATRQPETARGQVRQRLRRRGGEGLRADQLPCGGKAPAA